MNVLFHTATAVGLFSAVNNSSFNSFVKGGIFFFGGIIIHGILDYTPHCYPLDAKMDVIISTLVITFLLIGVQRENRVLLFISILGNTFPDLIDLGPSMFNKYLGFNIPIIDKVFPWHWKEYSGSLYSGDCRVSHFNHCAVILGVFISVVLNKTD